MRGSLLLFFILLDLCAVGQMDVTSSQTAQAMAENIAGQGVIILNATMNCPANASGLFKVINGNINLESGIVLTTGRAATLGTYYGVNGNSSDLASIDNGAPGDADLDILAGKRTVDACTLEFDVIPGGDTIQFNYVFSSEEYINSVCGPYNDAFGFFISGPGIPGHENMALIPGTNIPVTINTINNGIPGPIGDINNCTIAGSGSPFTAYYIDNIAGKTITHKGFTQVLKAKHKVTPCSTYHLKIVIADAGNPQYDSGVFLEAGSLQTDNYSINSLYTGPSVSQAFCVKGCLPGHFRVKRSVKKSIPQTIKFMTSGSAISGVDYMPIADSVIIPANDTAADITINGLQTSLTGPRTIRLSILSPYFCNGISNIIDSASLTIYDSIHVSIITSEMNVCKRDSVLLKVQGDDILTYNWSPATALSDAHIKEPVFFPSENTTYSLIASLPGTSCLSKKASVTFNMKPTPDIKLKADTIVCFNSSFQLDAIIADSDLYNRYKWAGPRDFSSTLNRPFIEHITSRKAGIYTVSVINDTNGCKSSASINVIVNTPGVPTAVSPVIICLNTDPPTLTADGKQLLWYDTLGQVSTEAPVPVTTRISSYTYFVTQTPGDCESPKTEINVEIKSCCAGPINIPTAFTPNGDGRNDIFEPLEAYGYTIKSMHIVNRWGQLVYSGTEGIWNGSFKGIPAEMGSYFYIISFECILGGTEVRKGDVTLIR